MNAGGRDIIYFYRGLRCASALYVRESNTPKKGYEGKMHYISMGFEREVLSMMKKKLSVGCILGI